VKGLHEQITKRSLTLDRESLFEKKSEIAALPTYLNVQFVRFRWKGDVKQKAKVLKPVEFPLALDLFDLCAPELKAELEVPRKARRDALDHPDQPQETSLLFALRYLLFAFRFIFVFVFTLFDVLQLLVPMDCTTFSLSSLIVVAMPMAAITCRG
jgi:hypothetical protein